MSTPTRILLEPGQTKVLAFDIGGLDLKASDGFKLCPKVVLESPDGRRIQEIPLCK